MSIETTTPSDAPEQFVFPRWANYLFPACLLLVIGSVVYVPIMIWVGLSPQTTEVGYAPDQPVAFSHRVHAGQLGMDCRYCHSTVETARFAAIPSTQICMNCHASVGTENEELQPVRNSYAEGTSIAWKKVHDLPDFVYFNHAAHVTQGVGCVTCHGRVDQMDVVYQHEPLSMSWCIECHRDPRASLRPRDQVTNMNWKADATDDTREALGTRLLEEHGIPPTRFMTSCTTCHR